MNAPIPTHHQRPMPISRQQLKRLQDEGWRAPSDILTTVEAVGLLPLGSIVKSGVYAYHRDRMGWFRTGTPAPSTPPLPVTVLWNPDSDQGTSPS